MLNINQTCYEVRDRTYLQAISVHDGYALVTFNAIDMVNRSYNL